MEKEHFFSSFRVLQSEGYLKISQFLCGKKSLGKVPGFRGRGKHLLQRGTSGRIAEAEKE